MVCGATRVLAYLLVLSVMQQAMKVCGLWKAAPFRHWAQVASHPGFRSTIATFTTSPTQESPSPKASKTKSKTTAPADAPSTAQGIEEIKKARISKLEQLHSQGMNPFAYTYNQTHKAAELQTLCADLPNGQENNDLEVSVCGRIMLRRVFGKLAFFTLQDDTGTVQLYLDKGHLEGTSFDSIKNLTDSGDIIGVKGTMKRTDKVDNDEISCLL
jgi:hypothetical protein